MSRSQKTAFRRTEPIADKQWTFPGGKYKGFSLDDVLYHDPRYIVWLQNNTDFDFHHSIIEEAENGPQRP